MLKKWRKENVQSLLTRSEGSSSYSARSVGFFVQVAQVPVESDWKIKIPFQFFQERRNVHAMRVVYAHFVDVAQVWVDLSYDQIVRLLLQIGVVIFVKLADKKLASTPYLPQFSFDRIEIIPDVFCLLFFLLSLQQGAQYKIRVTRALNRSPYILSFKLGSSPCGSGVIWGYPLSP